MKHAVKILAAAFLASLILFSCQSKAYKDSEAFSGICIRLAFQPPSGDFSQIRQELTAAKANYASWPEEMRQAADDVFTSLDILEETRKRSAESTAGIGENSGELSPLEALNNLSVLTEAGNSNVIAAAEAGRSFGRFVDLRQAYKTGKKKAK